MSELSEKDRARVDALRLLVADFPAEPAVGLVIAMCSSELDRVRGRFVQLVAKRIAADGGPGEMADAIERFLDEERGALPQAAVAMLQFGLELTRKAQGESERALASIGESLRNRAERRAAEREG